MTPYNVHDYRKLARKRLPRMVFDYVEGGSEDEKGLRRNITAFERYEFQPRRLVDVSSRSLQQTLWNRSYDMPLYISPIGLSGIVRAGGDAMLARAAAKAGIPFALSTASNMSIEEIAKSGDGEKWFQLYVLHRDISQVMCERALNSGYTTLILTVDVPVNGYRERDMRNGFAVPAKYTARTLLDGITSPLWSLDFLRHGTPELKNFKTLESITTEAQAALLRREMDAGFDFNALEQLRQSWPKKLIVKGLVRPEDVKRCAQIGVDAVILSNHGARQLDSTVPSIETVESAVIGSDLPVFVDGGFRRGADVIKALCLGASMVGLGRAALYALAANGEIGVGHCLDILKDEMDRTLAMLGAADVPSLTRDLVSESCR